MYAPRASSLACILNPLIDAVPSARPLRFLPLQTAFRFIVYAENRQLAGLNSTELLVVTTALRGTFFTDCGYETERHSLSLYQGCFRDVPSAPDMQLASRLVQPTLQLSGRACALACAAFTFYAMRGGDECVCGERFGRYGAVNDTECDTPCSGEPSRLCGGVNRSSVYRQVKRETCNV